MSRFSNISLDRTYVVVIHLLRLLIIVNAQTLFTKTESDQVHILRMSTRHFRLTHPQLCFDIEIFIRSLRLFFFLRHYLPFSNVFYYVYP